MARTVLAGIAAAVLFLGAAAQNATVRYIPADVRDNAWQQSLAAAQTREAATLAAFHDFQFTDRLAESGITYKNRIVDDAGKAYKAAHYDHGTGIAIADVDGDGLPDVYFVSQVGGNQLWRNLGGGRFEDITASAGVGALRKVSGSAPFADVDNDGDPDLCRQTVPGRNMRLLYGG